MTRPDGILARERWSGLLPGGAEALGIGACTLTFSAWNGLAQETIDPFAVLFFLALSYISTLAGQLVLERLRLERDRSEFATVFLFGFFFVASVLLVVSLALPFGIGLDGLLVALAVIAWRLAVPYPAATAPRRKTQAWPGLIATLISLWAATFWSLDAIRPMTLTHGVIIFKPWSDTFLHACIVRMFRDAHGLASLEDFILPGRPATIYHYATFVVPALLSAVTNTPCYLALTSLLIPLGVALTGFAAFALVRSWWGPGAGLAATVALLLLPDASSYGVRNPLLGYHWLQQVAPAGPYGVALSAVAWLLLFAGCRRRRPALLAASYVAAGLVLGYKAHLFVSNAFLLWTAPSLLYFGLKPYQRLAWLLLSVSSFVGVASLTHRVPSAPPLRLDGSGTTTYVEKLVFNLNDGPIKESLSLTSATPWREALTKGVIHLVFGTFGVLGPAYLLLLLPMLRRVGDDDQPPPQEPSSRWSAAAVSLFPLAVIVNYLVMSLGLAPDRENVNGSDELLHRPLVWAYFVVAAWVGGAFYTLVVKRWVGRSAVARTVLPTVVAGLLAVPFFLGKDVQVGPGWGKEVTNTPMPVGLHQCALFLRKESRPGDRIQDSGRDPTLALSAVSERPEYVVDYWDPRKKPLFAERLKEVESLEQTADFRALTTGAGRRKIRWYVLRPGTFVNWPRAFLRQPAFVAGEYRVYRLGESTARPSASRRER